jgi:hypothetical protein
VAECRSFIQALISDLHGDQADPFNRRSRTGFRRKDPEDWLKVRDTQLRLALAYLDVDGDFTTAYWLCFCGLKLGLSDVISRLPVYGSALDDRREAAYILSRCSKPACLMCGGDLRHVSAQRKQVVEMDVPSRECESMVFVVGEPAGGVTLDDMHRLLVDALHRLTEGKLFSRSFQGVRVDVDLFEKSGPYVHAHVIGWREPIPPDKFKARMAKLEAKFLKLGGPGARFHREPVRDLARALAYNAKGYKPTAKSQPHIGASDESLRAIVRLSKTRGEMHWGLGAWSREKLRPPKPATKPKKPAKRGKGRLARRQTPSPTDAFKAVLRRSRPPARLASSLVDGDGNPVRLGRVVAVPPELALVAPASVPPVPRPRRRRGRGAPARQRQDIIDAVVDSERSVLVTAHAGCGKTTAIKDAVSAFHDGDVLAIAYNVAAAKQLAEATAGLPYVTASTSHSVGFNIWRDCVGGARLSEKKVERLVTEVVGRDPIAGSVAALVREAKAKLWTPESASWPTAQSSAVVVECARAVLRLNNEREDGVDFDDMIYLPVIHNADFPRRALVCVDELQDLSPAQIEFALRLGERLLVVGDPRQSINAFRHADPHALETFSARLSPVELPLSYSFRCPKNVVALAQEIVPDIEAAPGNEDGEVCYPEGHYLDFVGDMKPGDLVVCRFKNRLEKLATALGKGRSRQLYSADGAPDRDRIHKMSRTKVNLATIHAAKGLGAERVWYIDAPLLEAGVALDAEMQATQEANGRYVAITRSAAQLFIVDSPRLCRAES